MSPSLMVMWTAEVCVAAVATTLGEAGSVRSTMARPSPALPVET